MNDDESNDIFSFIVPQCIYVHIYVHLFKIRNTEFNKKKRFKMNGSSKNCFTCHEVVRNARVEVQSKTRTIEIL